MSRLCKQGFGVVPRVGGWAAPFGITLATDVLSAFLVLLVGVLLSGCATPGLPDTSRPRAKVSSLVASAMSASSLVVIRNALPLTLGRDLPVDVLGQQAQELYIMKSQFCFMSGDRKQSKALLYKASD